MKKKVAGILILISLSMGCASNKQSKVTDGSRQDSSTDAATEVEVNNSTLELSDYLRRIPGVQVTGSSSNPRISVRTSTSVNNNIEPLYVIDGSRVGNSYQTAASQVDVNDIQSVKVLKDVSSTSMYGLQGANGVILIKTKSAN